MSQVLVFVEFVGKSLKSTSMELLSAAHLSGKPVHAMAVGTGSSGLAAAVGEFGVKSLICGENAQFDIYNPEVFLAFAVHAQKSTGASVILGSASAIGKDLLPRLAARVSGTVVSDCIEIKIDESTIRVKKPLYSGKCFSAVTLSGTGPHVVIMRPNQLSIQNPKLSQSTQVQKQEPSNEGLRTIVKDVVRGASTKLDLTEANIVVSGGRGMKGPEHFQLLNALADVLGATVGASRAVVDLGWVPHSMQVGQTGKTVSPSLYIACGISGMIQHLAGMSSSKVIVAINKDPEAPIFKRATYGIVGDVFEVLPALTAEFKRILSAG